MTYKTHALAFDNRVRIFWILVSICFVSSILYIYAVSSAVSNTVSRQSLEREVGTLAARIGEMEFTYIGMKNGVSLAVAYGHGFKDVSAPVYVSRAASASLSVNLNR
ncbi:MAG: hypothetical protein JWN50_141 [Parcubacteria group bacterium]|nr:hypothetical protein [Parcubacteria group bacterium]